MPSRTRAQQRTDAIDISPTKLLADIEQLRAEVLAAEVELEAAKAQAAEYLAGLQRERAEFQNYRRRTTEERDSWLGLASDVLLTKVLALADDFDRAIDSRPERLAGDAWADGIAAIDRKLRGLLESEGVTAIGIEPGTPFDPREHEALVSLPSAEHPEGTIVAELQRGYRIRDRVLRPARVAIAKAPDEPSEDGPPN